MICKINIVYVKELKIINIRKKVENLIVVFLIKYCYCIGIEKCLIKFMKGFRLCILFNFC